MRYGSSIGNSPYRKGPDRYICRVRRVFENTVKSHIKSIYVKLDIHSRAELIEMLSQEQGIVGGFVGCDSATTNA